MPHVGAEEGDLISHFREERENRKRTKKKINCFFLFGFLVWCFVEEADIKEKWQSYFSKLFIG